MYPPNQSRLRDLRRAVKAQRAAREALCDLRDNLSPGQFSEQMEDLLEEEVKDLELRGADIKVSFEDLEELIRNLSSEAP